MSTIDDFLGGSLDNSSYPALGVDTNELSASDSGGDSELVPITGIDPRMQLLSHSSRLLLHTCPKKYQLYKLNSLDSGEEDSSRGVTFAYGTAVGVGLQSVLEEKSTNQIFLDTFLAWDVDLLDRNDRQKKSFWEVMFCVQKFIHMKERGYLEDYELVYYQGAPAVELAFKVLMPDGFSYRGKVDAVLRHKTTGAIVVLEVKTSSNAPNSAQYKNSGQALGYSVVLDFIFPELSSYSVLYLIYHSRGREFHELRFDKSLLQRALWLQELILDSKLVDLYEETEAYPMHGESCYNFFSPCEYLGLCTLSTENLVKPLTVGDVRAMDKREEEYKFVVDFNDLVEAQIKKGEM